MTFYNWIEKIVRQAQDDSQMAVQHFETNVVDSSAIGEKVRSVALDMYEVEGGALLEASWSPADYKILSQKFNSVEDAQSNFSKLKAELLEINKLVIEGKLVEAETASKSFLDNAQNLSKEPIQQSTNQPITHTQASKYKVSIIYPDIDKVAKATIQNIFFSTVAELLAYQDAQKAITPTPEINPGSSSPEMNPALVEGNPTGTEASPSVGPSNAPAKPSALEKMITDKVTEQVESSLDTHARAVFEDVHAETVKVMRKLGRSWEEIKDFFNRYLKYDWDDIDVFLDQFVRAEAGDTVQEDPGVEKVKHEMSDSRVDAPPPMIEEPKTIPDPGIGLDKKAKDQKEEHAMHAPGMCNACDEQSCPYCGKGEALPHCINCGDPADRKHDHQLCVGCDAWRKNFKEVPPVDQSVGIPKKADLVREPDDLKAGDKVTLVRSIMTKENLVLQPSVEGTIIQANPYNIVIESKFGRFTISKHDCKKLDKVASLQTISEKYYLDPLKEYLQESDLVAELDSKLGKQGQAWKFSSEKWEVQSEQDMPYVEVVLTSGRACDKCGNTNRPVEESDIGMSQYRFLCEICYLNESGQVVNSDQHSLDSDKPEWLKVKPHNQNLKKQEPESYVWKDLPQETQAFKLDEIALHSGLGEVLVQAVGDFIQVEDRTGSSYWVEPKALFKKKVVASPKFKIGDKVVCGSDNIGPCTVVAVNELSTKQFNEWFMSAFDITPSEMEYSQKGTLYTLKTDQPFEDQAFGNDGQYLPDIYYAHENTLLPVGQKQASSPNSYWWCLTCGKEVSPEQQQECYFKKHKTELLKKQADLAEDIFKALQPTELPIAKVTDSRLPPCCKDNSKGPGVCMVCKQPSCVNHQSSNGVSHTYCKKQPFDSLIEDKNTEMKASSDRGFAFAGPEISIENRSDISAAQEIWDSSHPEGRKDLLMGADLSADLYIKSWDTLSKEDKEALQKNLTFKG